MILTSKISEVAPDFYCLGPENLPVFLMDGDAPALFDAGMSIMADHYLGEIKKILDNRPLAYLFLSHMHYDHNGAAGHIKKTYPNVEICASETGAKIITKPSALELIKKLSTFPGMTDDQMFIPFTVDRIIADDQSIRLSDDIQVKAIATPGHTRDMLSYYIPHLKIMLPSESVGMPSQDGHIISEFLVGYEIYMNSLEKLSGYDCNILVMAHHFIYTGEDAKNFIIQSKAQSERFKNYITDLLRQYQGDHGKVVHHIKKKEYDSLPEPKFPEQAYIINLNAKINAVAKLMTS